MGRNDKRHIACELDDGTVLHNFYVPAGGYEPDAQTNPSFQHKLDFVDAMTEWSQQQKGKMILVGDLNIAPHEHDVWSHKQMLKVISHTPAETDRMFALIDTLGWVDTAREFIDMSEKAYTWWSYRNKDWKKSNRGRRLDHIWVTPDLKSRLKSYNALPTFRDLERPSDHVPVIIELN